MLYSHSLTGRRDQMKINILFLKILKVKIEKVQKYVTYQFMMDMEDN